MMKNMQSQIEKSENEIKAQVEFFKMQATNKKNEEIELLKVLKDYSAKYTEFNKSLKKSGSNTKTFEKEVRYQEQERAKAEKEKAQLVKRTGFKEGEDANAIVVAMEMAWEQEKVTLVDERDKLKEFCAQLQLRLKEKQAAK